MPTLDQFLDGVYQERHLRKPLPGLRFADLTTAVRDPAVRSEAAQKLAALSTDICNRCFVSKVYRDVLREALQPHAEA